MQEYHKAIDTLIGADGTSGMGTGKPDDNGDDLVRRIRATTNRAELNAVLAEIYGTAQKAEQVLEEPIVKPIPAPSIAAYGVIQDHRFAHMFKGERFAFARGLTINPTHLPQALDAMSKDGWELVAIFGETDAKNIGFIFRRPDIHIYGAGDLRRHINEETLSQALTVCLDDRNRAVARSQELHEVNYRLVEQRREAVGFLKIINNVMHLFENGTAPEIEQAKRLMADTVVLIRSFLGEVSITSEGK